MDLADQIEESVQTLEALYFLLKSFAAHQSRLAMLRAQYSRLGQEDKGKTLEELVAEIASIRDHSGALAKDEEYRRLLADARQRRGRAYLSKLYIDSRLFSRYDRVFTRWPHVKVHALVVFDGKSMEDLLNILEIEGLLFDDVQILLARAREAHKDIDDFRRRSREDQAHLQSYLRTASTAIFHFLEAYLNGLAYDCFHLHHDKLSLDDHDLLGEWNSTKKKIRYISFKKKLFCYPAIVAKMEGIKLDLSGRQFANDLAGYAKDIRDALTHPSYYIDPKSGFQEKLVFITGVNLALVEQMFVAAQEYVVFVETSLRRDPKQTTWLDI
jgi:hypothetical protein